jgi:hypothetical protein
MSERITISGQSKQPVESSKRILVELAVYVDFMGTKTTWKQESRHIATEIRKFKSIVDDVFSDPLEALERSLGNADLLSNHEIDFIRRANHLKTLSRSLFTLLVESIACSKAHAARLHLSGFLDDDINFELFITECEKQHWNFAKCRW